MSTTLAAVRQTSQIVLFDGVCTFCNGSVQFILARDKGNRFCFAALQSESARELRTELGWPADLDSIILVDRDRYYYKSTAALRIARQLSGLWPVLAIFLLIPRFIRDFFYDAFARRRYAWFGKQESCLLPTPEVRKRFLS